MKKQVTSVVLSAAMLASAVLPTVGAGLTAGAESSAPAAKVSSSLPLQAWYDEPAEQTHEGWEQHATPLGNGFLGAMVFGGVAKDKIQVNEHTLWSGGPGANADYNGGVKGTKEEHHATLQDVRAKLKKVSEKFAEYMKENPNGSIKNYDEFYTAAGVNKSEVDAQIQSLFGEKSNFGSYQTLEDIYITDTAVAGDTVDGKKTYSDYRRTLDLNEGMATVSYKQSGVTYTREYFVSNPGNVMVVRLTASEKGKLSRKISIDTPQTNKSVYGDMENNTITMTGQPADQSADGLKFAQQIKVVAEGGSILTLGDASYVDKADAITIYMTAGTNYKQSVEDLEKDLNDYFSDEDPLIAVEARIKAAAEKGYDKQLAEHKADYKALFNAMQLNITGATTVPGKPTDELLANYRARYEAASKADSDPNAFTDFDWYTSDDLYLENLYFQFGRYLLIASSREGSLPANLQGIWADSLNPPWNADYHTNINLQMNYWLAEQTNLAECHMPVIEYVQAQVPRGKEIAQNYYCTEDGKDVRGFTFHHENNVWGNAAPGESGASYAPESAAWACQDIWEYYQFNQDKEYLAKYYDVLLQSALFWVDNLVENADGKLVASPSYSPEHGPFTEGATFVQGVVWEIFNEVIEASKVLGKTGDSEVKEIAAAQEKLLKPTVETSIGSVGQFLEWEYETRLDSTEDKLHRHTNHLFVLHPSNQVVAGRSEDEDKMVEAMKVTLNNRTDGGTGWSKAWKINFWARTREGDRSHKVLSSLIGGTDQGGNSPTTADNLFDLHSPFQIDGNFGATAGMAEMLLQSQGDAIELLAATPQTWSSGTVTGMKARGNVEVDMTWRYNELSGATLRPGTDNDALKVKGTNIANGKLVDSNGNEVKFTATGNDTIVFAAKAGETYTIEDIVDPEGLTNATNTLKSSIVAARRAYNAKKPTDELYDEAANKSLKDAIDAAQALVNSATSDKFALIDANTALNNALKAFNSAYDLKLSASLDAGIYSSAQQVELSCSSSIVQVRYTLDGSTPTKDSALYATPIILPYGATKLRAATFYNDKMVGTALSTDYLVTPSTDLAVGGGVTEASGSTISGYPVTRITDGNISNRWATTSNAGTDIVVTVDLKSAKTFDSYLLDEFRETNQGARVTSLKVEYQDGANWVEIPVADSDMFKSEPAAKQHAYKAASFKPVTAQVLRLTMQGKDISIWEFSLYNSSTLGDKTALRGLYNAYSQLNPDNYVDATAFVAALKAAKEVLDNANATESDVNVAAKTLENTKNALVLKDMRGDIDDNGKVTAADALLALKAATNTITLTDAQQKRADVDGQEGVSVIDALMILENAAGKIALNPSDDLTPVVTPDPIPADLPTATKAQLKAVMDKAVDLDRYTADSVKTYTGTMAACNAVYANADASGENIYRALNALQVAIDGLQEKAQDNWIGDFTKIVGKHTVLGQGQNLLYADWKQLDQTSLDVSEDRDHLFLQMTIVLQSTNPNVDPAKMWSGLTVKLRSADKGGVAGDPEMEKGNTEHNYGWNFSPSNFDGSSTLTVSIPLNKANTNKKGVMDWTDVQRLIVQCQLNGNCTGDMYQYTMLIKSAHIVDGTPLKEAADTLAATITKAGTSGGDALTAAKATLQTAQDMLAGKNALVNLYDLKKANTDLLAAIG